eukprot:1930252-Rhodomonas_salina.1
MLFGFCVPLQELNLIFVLEELREAGKHPDSDDAPQGVGQETLNPVDQHLNRCELPLEPAN